METNKTKIEIPIYDATLWVVVADDIRLERSNPEFSRAFGTPPDCEYDALTSYDGRGNFALFFQRGAATTKRVAHEVFHLTHRILDWVGANFDAGHHETAALLNGYLTGVVFATLKDQIREDPAAPDAAGRTRGQPALRNPKRKTRRKERQDER